MSDTSIKTSNTQTTAQTMTRHHTQTTSSRQALNNCRAKISEDWQAYLDQGIKYHSIPLQVRNDPTFVSDEVSTTLSSAYNPANISSIGSEPWRFRQCHSFLARAEVLVDKLVAAGNLEVAGRQIAGAEVFGGQLRQRVAKLNWAVEELVAARNAMGARGELTRGDESALGKLVGEFADWAGMLGGLGEGTTKMSIEGALAGSG